MRALLRLDINFLFTILNLLILYFLMKKFLFNPVNNIMKKRKELLEQQFAEANSTRESAMELKGKYEEAVYSAKTLSEQIVLDAKARAKDEYDRIIKQSDEDAQKIFQKAKKDIAMERSKVLCKMEGEITDLAIAAATKIISEKSTAENDQKLYDHFLAEAGERYESNNN
ncbi:F0F1 ATP synthase subunit B [Caproiciproducens galactitolivorans]|uniref:ATP synthase subunit b n=1 Tax=Caproiciproducens galactitolivorans TaxID=642589 RepID=A0ABT4BRK2_9FIRM|nr:F0F1 ATP synthase subunit B [Caproiciproducens galactitolivorans]MCY1712975.1 F0F1 ATP synthase subunit B [Caproiciproducens galactitolivorans]